MRYCTIATGSPYRVNSPQKSNRILTSSKDKAITFQRLWPSVISISSAFTPAVTDQQAWYKTKPRNWAASPWTCEIGWCWQCGGGCRLLRVSSASSSINNSDNKSDSWPLDPAPYPFNHDSAFQTSQRGKLTTWEMEVLYWGKEKQQIN